MTDTILPDQGAPEQEPVELSLAAQVLLLQEEHRSLDERIKGMYDFPSRDELVLQRLKKKKLRLKDMIARLKGDLIPDLNA